MLLKQEVLVKSFKDGSGIVLFDTNTGETIGFSKSFEELVALELDRHLEKELKPYEYKLFKKMLTQQ
ncbi:hypothetical protein AGRI_15085 [Alishewanella agri BL06]|uniref:Uncharacterized protein n=1 Tax=Alishewanella agri BL06 TaxID=1195246 RepID=I9NZH4_9ALTE|nr:hypothetical protein AGRI_15085 [Alishewanella agri BL06]